MTCGIGLLQTQEKLICFLSTPVKRTLFWHHSFAHSRVILVAMENAFAPQRPQLLLFDVYETLLDMEMVERKINSLLDSKKGYALWFELFVQYCCIDNLLATPNSFAAIATATLQMAGRIMGEPVTEEKADEAVDLLNHLPLKEGITDTFTQLYDQGFRIAALTNAPKDIILNRMERTGLVSYFEAVLSAEEVHKYKPAPLVYQWAAAQLGLPPGEIMLVSSHDWDVTGAANAGMQTAYVQSKSKLFYPLAPEPDLRLQDIEDLTAVYANVGEQDFSKR